MPSFKIEICETRRCEHVIEAESEADALAEARQLAFGPELCADTVDREITVLEVTHAPKAQGV